MNVKNSEISKLAHKANSPLTSIIGYIALCQKEAESTKDVSKISEWLYECDNSIEALKEIIKQIGEKTNL